jgi:hypothetical protein
VSLTITEDGYGIDDHTDAFVPHDELTLADLADPAGPPRSVLVYFNRALRARRDRGLAPFTVSNFPSLGHRITPPRTRPGPPWGSTIGLRRGRPSSPRREFPDRAVMDDHRVLGPQAGDDRGTPAPNVVLVLIVDVVSGGSAANATSWLIRTSTPWPTAHECPR